MIDEKTNKMTELELEKLNIVDKQGTVRMTLFNQDHIPPALMDGEDILPGHRDDNPFAGIMFFNNEGDECGGMIFGNERDEEGNYRASASMTFDQYKQDQVVQMMYIDDNGERHYGFNIFDRPDVSLKQQLDETKEIEESHLDDEAKAEAIDQVWKGSTQRAFMGKNKKGEVSVKLMDSKGKDRIRMVVDENDIPRMEFLDGEGNVLYKLPPDDLKK
ncbi:hypothetical protein [Falsibacillus pallidus]|uniref:Uncharacterized protein n=1 Tax=Falsibacillus pallidus TaxID=493781 RepID=A0A370GA71_9BACI|nr:hypothetical protein [Falsibacillus pallidus]RDI39929.1 hypothetical protein DFR59_11488 [Falsibacillus pallidus]